MGSTTSPLGYKLDVNGDVFANGGVFASGNVDVGGSVSASSFNTVSSDVAENYPTNDISLEAGDIVAPVAFPRSDLGSDKVFIEKAGSSTDSIIGVVSEKPGVLLGNSFPRSDLGNGSLTATTIPVALSGRVPVKVNLDGGEIKIGDRITVSNTSGVGMRAGTSSQQTVGIALEDFPSTGSGQVAVDGTITYDRNAVGKILVFVNLSQYRLALEDEPIIKNHEQRITDSETKIADLELRVANLENIMASSTPFTFPRSDLGNATTSDSVISQAFNWILEQFKTAGIIIADGVIQAKGFIADAITTHEMTADYVQAKEQLVVGSKEKPTGITIFDKLSGEPACVYLESGILKSTPGECGAEALAGIGSLAGTVSALEFPENSTSSIPTLGEVGTPTTTPETISTITSVTPTPDVGASGILTATSTPITTPETISTTIPVTPTPDVGVSTTPETVATTTTETASTTP